MRLPGAPPPQRSADALRKRAEKRGRTEEEQRALDRGKLNDIKAERKEVRTAEKDAKRRRVGGPQNGAFGGGGARVDGPQRPPPPPPSPPPKAEVIPQTLTEIVAGGGSHFVGHTLDIAGKGAAKVTSSHGRKGGGGLDVKVRFETAITTSHDRGAPERRQLSLTITMADVEQGKFKLAAGSKADWKCIACSFRNFGSRDACNQCHGKRFSATTSAGGGSFAAPAIRRVPAAKKNNVDPSRAWEGSVVTPARLLDNKRLREQFASKPFELSDADRLRAEQLLERDRRKGAKKTAYKERLARGIPGPGFRVRRPDATS
ncbi:hypothetical protein T492DRAFT_1052884 [Pavlovales sp. CCMP2436]|nr:hypothetical protein T492DRAFT_1052884 [Pavlovales sp. CCMP2436]